MLIVGQAEREGGREEKGGLSFWKSHLELLQLWVEVEEGHVAHVGTRRGVTLSHQHEP